MAWLHGELLVDGVNVRLDVVERLHEAFGASLPQTNRCNGASLSRANGGLYIQTSGLFIHGTKFSSVGQALRGPAILQQYLHDSSDPPRLCIASSWDGKVSSPKPWEMHAYDKGTRVERF